MEVCGFGGWFRKEREGMGEWRWRCRLPMSARCLFNYSLLNDASTLLQSENEPENESEVVSDDIY